MPSDAFEVQLVSPEQILFEGEAEMVVCRPLDGDIAFLKDHVPYLGVLADDAVRIILPGDAEAAAAVHGGFVQMNGDKLVVLSDLAELKEQIDVPRAQQAKQTRRGSALAAIPTTPRRRRRSPGPRPASRSRPDSSLDLLACPSHATAPLSVWPSSCSVVRRCRRWCRVLASRRRRPPSEPSLTRVPARRARGSTSSTTRRACRSAGAEPRVTPDSVSDMAALGVKTLYVQVANPDGAPANQLTDRAELRALLERAHDHDIAVVPWFLPRAVVARRRSRDDEADREAARRGRVVRRHRPRPRVERGARHRRCATSARSRSRSRCGSSSGRRCRWRRSCTPRCSSRCSTRRCGPTSRTRASTSTSTLWMPMSYYTYRSTESGLRSAYLYTVDSVDRLAQAAG